MKTPVFVLLAKFLLELNIFMLLGFFLHSWRFPVEKALEAALPLKNSFCC